MSVANATAPSQGAVDPGTGAGEPQGTAQASQEQNGQFNWNLFPGVPEEQRPVLEPHLRQVQSYITKLEMERAPFKPIMDAGFDAETIQGVMDFTTRMQQDPMGTLFQLMQQFQQNGIIHQDLDLDAVRAIANGDEPEAGAAGDIVEQPPGQDEMPPWAQQMQQQMGQMAQFLQQQQQQQQKGAQDRLLNQNLDNLRTALTEAKVDVSSVGDEQAQDRYLTALLITHNMDPAAAAQSVTGFRDASIQNFTEDSENTDPSRQELDLPQGAPKARKPPSDSDVWGKANAGARNMLERNMRAEAQGT